MYSAFPVLDKMCIAGVLVSYGCVTNRHHLSGLKQLNFIILQFWRSKVRYESNWAKIKMSTGLRFFLEALEVNLFPCLFQVL